MEKFGVLSAWDTERASCESEQEHGRMLDLLLQNGFTVLPVRTVIGPGWKVVGASFNELATVAADFGMDRFLYGTVDALQWVRADRR